MRICVWCLLGLGVLGCDRDQVAAPPPKRAAVLGVDVQIVTPLPPNRITHVAPARDGAIFWVQETDGGRDTAFAMSENSVPVVTTLTSAAVAEALGASGAVGNMQSICVANDGRLYFYFSGGKGKKLLAAVGSYSPENGRMRIIADTRALMAESELGDSLALARGSLLLGGAGDVLWVWLRHDDGYAFLSMDLRLRGAKIGRAFPRVRGEEEVRTTSPGEDLAVGPENSLLYVDRSKGKIWRIGAAGEIEQTADVSELPAGVTAPSLDEKGRMVVFAPEETTLNELELIPTARATKYPALVILKGKERIVLGRGVFTAPANFNIRAMTLGQLVRDRSGWLSYDKQTGELLRLRVVER